MNEAVFSSRDRSDAGSLELTLEGRVLCLRTKTQHIFLKEFHRVVQEATNLVRLCCNQESWLMAIFCMVDGKETFTLTCSELLWFKRVVESFEIVQEWYWKSRLDTAVREDHSNLQRM